MQTQAQIGSYTKPRSIAILRARSYDVHVPVVEIGVVKLCVATDPQNIVLFNLIS